MNYVIFKGVDSRTISGLYIQELWPYQIPEANILQDEVDGYDGDYTSIMNYKCTDKEITIGLNASCDRNAVINYFRGSGVLIGSKEPQRFYNAVIYQSSDLERAVRFHSGTVKFHCQPYKYVLDEADTVLSAAGTVNNQGLIASLPKMVFSVTGDFTLTLNNEQIFVYTFQTGDTTMTVDSAEMNCYNQDGTVRNRALVGKFPKLAAGSNSISWDANVSSVTISPRSRWLG